MIKWYKSLSEGRRILVLWVGIVVMGNFNWLLYELTSERKAKVSTYIAEHKCKIVSYAGRDAEPVYQCNTGLLIHNLLVDEALR
jgi:hypothetical protein